MITNRVSIYLVLIFLLFSIILVLPSTSNHDSQPVWTVGDSYSGTSYSLNYTSYNEGQSMTYNPTNYYNYSVLTEIELFGEDVFEVNLVYRNETGHKTLDYIYYYTNPYFLFAGFFNTTTEISDGTIQQTEYHYSYNNQLSFNPSEYGVGTHPLSLNVNYTAFRYDPENLDGTNYTTTLNQDLIYNYIIEEEVIEHNGIEFDTWKIKYQLLNYSYDIFAYTNNTFSYNIHLEFDYFGNYTGYRYTSYVENPTSNSTAFVTYYGNDTISDGYSWISKVYNIPLKSEYQSLLGNETITTTRTNGSVTNIVTNHNGSLVTTSISEVNIINNQHLESALNPTTSTTYNPTTSTTYNPTTSTYYDPTTSSSYDPTTSTSDDHMTTTVSEPTTSTTYERTTFSTQDPDPSTTEDPTSSIIQDPTVSTTENMVTSTIENLTTSINEDQTTDTNNGTTYNQIFWIVGGLIILKRTRKNS